jgi:hypothetical protein
MAMQFPHRARIRRLAGHHRAAGQEQTQTDLQPTFPYQIAHITNRFHNG